MDFALYALRFKISPHAIVRAWYNEYTTWGRQVSTEVFEPAEASRVAQTRKTAQKQ